MKPPNLPRTPSQGRSRGNTGNATTGNQRDNRGPQREGKRASDRTFVDFCRPLREKEASRKAGFVAFHAGGRSRGRAQHQGAPSKGEAGKGARPAHGRQPRRRSDCWVKQQQGKNRGKGRKKNRGNGPLRAISLGSPDVRGDPSPPPRVGKKKNQKGGFSLLGPRFRISFRGFSGHPPRF